MKRLTPLLFAMPSLAFAADGTDLFDVMIGFMVIVILAVLALGGLVFWLAKKQNKDPKAVLSDLIPDSLESKLESGLHIHLHTSPTTGSSPSSAASASAAPSTASPPAIPAAASSPAAPANTTAAPPLSPPSSPPSSPSTPPPPMPPAPPAAPYQGLQTMAGSSADKFVASDGTPLPVMAAQEATRNAALYAPNGQSNARQGEQTTTDDGFPLWYARSGDGSPIGPARIMYDGNTYPDSAEGRAQIGHYQAALAARAGNLDTWTNVAWTGAIAATSLTVDDWCWINLKQPADKRSWEEIVGGDADYCKGMIGYAFYNALASFRGDRRTNYNGVLKQFAP